MVYRVTANEDPNQWVLMSVEFTALTCSRFLFWSGKMDDTRMMMQINKEDISYPKFYFHSVMAMDKDETRLYCCPTNNSYDVAEFNLIDNTWTMIKDLKSSKTYYIFLNNLTDILNCIIYYHFQLETVQYFKLSCLRTLLLFWVPFQMAFVFGIYLQTTQKHYIYHTEFVILQ